jgi:hypothetical protein
MMIRRHPVMDMITTHDCDCADASDHNQDQADDQGGAALSV